MADDRVTRLPPGPSLDGMPDELSETIEKLQAGAMTQAEANRRTAKAGATIKALRAALRSMRPGE
jgi:hypothetical protein